MESFSVSYVWLCFPFSSPHSISSFHVIFKWNLLSGQEIAQYCSKKLPDFIKNTEAYKNGDLKQALEEAFSDIDKSIITEEVIKELKELVGEQDDDDDDLDEAAMLSKEANIPIEELLSKMKQVSEIDSWISIWIRP